MSTHESSVAKPFADPALAISAAGATLAQKFPRQLQFSLKAADTQADGAIHVWEFHRQFYAT